MTTFDGDVVSTDLINQGQPTLGSSSATAGANFPASGANDGSASNSTYYANPPSSNGTPYADLTYTLNTNPGSGGSATGYSLSSINAVYGWGDSRYRHAAQEWTVSVETVGNPASFSDVYSVLYHPFAAGDNAAGSSEVTLTGSLPTNVIAINFHLNAYGVTGDPGYTGEIGVVHEFDVLGASSPAPEPASLGLLAIGATAMLGRRRRA